MFFFSFRPDPSAAQANKMKIILCDPTINFSHLVEELGVLYNWSEKVLDGLVQY